MPEKAAPHPLPLLFQYGEEEAQFEQVTERHVQSGSTNGGCLPSSTRSVPGKTRGGSFPGGASPYGCEEMAGNVWEWVEDVWTDPGGWLGVDGRQQRGILRGGASSYSSRQARTSYHGFEALDTTCHDVGFRCAMSARKRE